MLRVTLGGTIDCWGICIHDGMRVSSDVFYVLRFMITTSDSILLSMGLVAPSCKDNPANRVVVPPMPCGIIRWESKKHFSTSAFPKGTFGAARSPILAHFLLSRGRAEREEVFLNLASILLGCKNRAIAPIQTKRPPHLSAKTVPWHSALRLGWCERVKILGAKHSARVLFSLLQ